MYVLVSADTCVEPVHFHHTITQDCTSGNVATVWLILDAANGYQPATQQVGSVTITAIFRDKRKAETTLKGLNNG